METGKLLTRFYVIGTVSVLLTVPSTALSVCDYQPDAPDCTCFNNTGAWDAGGPSATLPIQSVALDTLGTRESCHTSAPVDDDCGKPYYQLTLGMNTVAGALTASYILSEAGTPTYTSRQEWCSETVSYWHREAGIPYTLGYRNDWHADWRNYSVPQMRMWYEQAEAVGGRGRWIESGEVDYGAADLGVTIPTPGAYMAISCLHPNPTASWCNPAQIDRNHSLMIDELWIHRDGHGDVFKMEATFLEGNSNREVKNSRHLDDLYSFTTGGSQWLSYNNGTDGIADTADDWGVKIYGFGIALDVAGDPVYDDTRLHYVEHPAIRRVLARARPVDDKPWKNFYVSIKDKLTDYTKALQANGGPSINALSGNVKAEKTPDGVNEKWLFTRNLQNEEVVVEFDYLNRSPLLVHGLTLFWDAKFIPSGYKVYFGPDKDQLTEAKVPDMSGLKLPKDSTPIPVTARLPSAQRDIRFIRFVFPKNTFTQTTMLTEMIVDYDHGPSEDTSNVPEDVPLFVDILPGECPNVVTSSSDDNMVIAVLSSDKVNADGIDTQTIMLNGQKVVLQSFSYKDLAMPFIGTDPGCHEEGGDGMVDLILNYKIDDVIEALRLKARKGETTPIVVTGQLNDGYSNRPFVGQDFIKVSVDVPQPVFRWGYFVLLGVIIVVVAWLLVKFHRRNRI